MKIRLSVPLNLDHTLKCGQAFRWGKIGNFWYGVVDGNIVKIRQVNDNLEFYTGPEKRGVDFIKNYFRLDDDLPKMLDRINRDEKIGRAIKKFYGLRLVRQEPFECLVSYVCSRNAKIKKIRDVIFKISRKYGRKIEYDDYVNYTFPSPDEIADTSLNELEKCRFRYGRRQAGEVLEIAKKVRKGDFDLESLRKLDYEKAKEKLISKERGRKLLPGVGQKVADCILLFSLDKLEAFPVDIWIIRMILDLYPEHFDPSFIKKVSSKIESKKWISRKEYNEINSFGRDYFGKYAGYAQEYLFYYERSL